VGRLRLALPVLALIGLGACDAGSAAQAPDAEVLDAAWDEAEPESVTLQSGVFLPGFRVGGQWYGGGRDGDCTSLGGETTCEVSGVGTVTLVGDTPARAGEKSRIVISAQATSGEIEAVEAVADLDLPGANAWISNGFQSWSQSGALALAPPVDAAALDAALTARGDPEVLRDGRALSWTYTAVGGGADTFEALLDPQTAREAKGWFQVSRSPDAPDRVRVRMAVGGDGDAAATGAFLVARRAGAAGTPAVSPFAPGAEAERVPPLSGWNSWYELYEAVDEAAVRDNAARLAEVVAANPAFVHPHVVVDDGWQRGWGDWRHNDKFPNGFERLSADLDAMGFRLGLWLAPLLVAADDPVVTEHPDWLVGDLVYPHAVNGDMRVLDITHPDARAHLLDALRALSVQGVRLFKLDFLFAGTWPGARHVPMTGMAAYTLFWTEVRAALPPDTALVAVGAPPLPTLDFVDAWRVGSDIAVPNFGVSWAFLPSQLRNLAARQPFCLRGQCDADPVLLRVQGPDAVEFGAYTVAAAGGGLFLSDDLRALDPVRLEAGLTRDVLDKAFGAGATPESLFPPDAPDGLVSGFSDAIARKSRHVVPVLWRFADGARAAFNVTDTPLEVEGVTVPPHAVRPVPP
jgi:alpha-galactosidase